MSINYETWWKIIANIIALVTHNIAVSSTKEKNGKPYFNVQEQILKDTSIFTLNRIDCDKFVLKKIWKPSIHL